MFSVMGRLLCMHAQEYYAIGPKELIIETCTVKYKLTHKHHLLSWQLICTNKASKMSKNNSELENGGSNLAFSGVVCLDLVLVALSLEVYIQFLW